MLIVTKKTYALTAFVIAIALNLHADEAVVGKVVIVKGKASVIHFGNKEIQDLKFNDEIRTLDTLQTEKGFLRVIFQDQTLLSLEENSKVLITEHVYKPQEGIRESIFDILKGKVRTIVDKVSAAQINSVSLQTPTAVAGIRGTDVGISVSKGTTEFLCFDGIVDAYPKGSQEKSVTLSGGEFTSIANREISAPAPIPPESRQQFSLQPVTSREVLHQSGTQNLQPPPPENGNPSKENSALRPPPEKATDRAEKGNEDRPKPPKEGQAPGQNPNNPQGPPPPPPGNYGGGGYAGGQPPPPPPPPLLPGGTNQTPPPGVMQGSTNGGSTGDSSIGGTTGGSGTGTTGGIEIPLGFPTPG